MPSLADKWHSAILKNSLDLLRYEAGLRTEIIAMIMDLGRQLVREIADSGLDTSRTDWQRSRLRELLNTAKDRIESEYGGIAGTHIKGLTGAAEVSATGLTITLNGVAGADLLQSIQWTPQLLKALVDGTLIEGAPSADWWARQAVDLQQAFADAMRQGMLRGETLGQMTARTRDLIDISARNARSLVQTSALAVNNAAQLATYRANADVIESLQWTATLDPHTCIECGLMDGTVWPLEEAHAMPPLHWGCRCVCVPITKTLDDLEMNAQDEELNRLLDEMAPGTRASMGGQVSGDTTWKSWLGSQSKEVQAEVLGPARLKLWESGKLSISQLVDQQGNTLTLAELATR